jgi:hypothetical protein
MDDLALPADTNGSTIFGRGERSKASFTVTDLFGSANATFLGTVTVV